MKIPFLELKRVLHIGTFDKKKKFARGESLEGHLLSVSTCPLAWRSIARLGGNPLHQMMRGDDKPGLFLDVYRIDDELKSVIQQWGLDNGYIEPFQWTLGWSYDDENGDWNYSYYTSSEAALLEVDCCGEYESIAEVPGPDGNPGIQVVDGFCGTQKLADSVSNAQVLKCDPFNFLVIVWAQTLENVDGVWWNELYAPERYSSPRGGIFPEKLMQWIPDEVQWRHAEDRPKAFKKVTRPIDYDIHSESSFNFG